MPVKQRVISFVEYLGLSNRAFEQECGLSNGLLNNIKQSISPATTEKISARYPELNMGWILTGEGEMLRRR